MKRSVTPTARALGMQGRQSSGENSADFSHHSIQFRAAVSGRDAPRQVRDRPPAHTHRRPLLRSPLGSAPPPLRPGRAPLPLPGAEAPGPAEWVSACPRARAEARPSPSPLRAPELRWEPPRAERPENARSPELRPAYLLRTYLCSLPAARPCPGELHTRVPTPFQRRTSLSLKQCSLPPSVREQAFLPSDKLWIFHVNLASKLSLQHRHPQKS